MTDAPAVVVIDRLSRSFANVPAVEALTLSVGAGEMFGIVGPDGAGKTTTLRMLAGVLTPTSGDALVLGSSVVAKPERVKQDIAYMSQRFGQYEDLTVRENILFYADLYEVPRGERAARIDRLYRFSNLGEFEHRLAGKLSGGMKQKLSLSCALIHHPKVLLLDEPTFGVDPISRRELWLILEEMAAEGVTVIMTTSYLDEAERCGRVAMLHNGRLIALDEPAALQRTLSGLMLSVRARPLFAAREALRASAAVAAASMFGETIHVVMRERGSEPAIFAALAAAAIEVEAVESIEASLEDVFISRVTAA